jgi:hypothetical protein
MLVEFQQALADLVASPEACRRARKNPEQLRLRYDLSPREYDRLVAMINHKGMAWNCMLYRANRLSPLVLNLPEFCRALGRRLGPLLSEYAERYPNTNVHFYLECDRFCRFIEGKLSEGYYLEPDALGVFSTEYANVKLSLAATSTTLAPSGAGRPAP